MSNFIRGLSKIKTSVNGQEVEPVGDDPIMKEYQRKGLDYTKAYLESTNKRQYSQYFSTFSNIMFYEVSNWLTANILLQLFEHCSIKDLAIGEALY